MSFVSGRGRGGCMKRLIILIDIGFEIRALAVCGRTHYLSAQSLHNIESLRLSGEERISFI